MNASLWHQELLRAATADEILSTLRDYLVLWRPDELAQLPVPCDPAQFEETLDVSEYAAALLEHEGDGRRAPAREALTTFFAVAATRVAQLHAHSPFDHGILRETAEA
jgi:hypothetical protein